MLPQGLESKICNEEYIQNFETLLGIGTSEAPFAMHRVPEDPPSTPEGSLTTSSSEEMYVAGHPTYALDTQCPSNFLLSDIWAQTVDAFRKVLLRAAKPDKMNTILVGVIDDGVNLDDFSAGNRFQGWQPGVVPPPHKRGNAWYYSHTGHGTEMAKIIQHVCPYANLFIGKLDTKAGSSGSVAASAAKVRKRTPLPQSNTLHCRGKGPAEH